MGNGAAVTGKGSTTRYSKAPAGSVNNSAKPNIKAQAVNRFTLALCLCGQFLQFGVDGILALAHGLKDLGYQIIKLPVQHLGALGDDIT